MGCDFDKTAVAVCSLLLAILLAAGTADLHPSLSFVMYITDYKMTVNYFKKKQRKKRVALGD